MYEWTDPNTGEEHRCPKVFMAVIDHLRFGAANPRYADELLRLMGKEVAEDNERHLRQAIMIHRLQGVLIVSVRSGKKGGYFLATPDDTEEVEAFCSLQEKLGRAMLANAAIFRKKFAELRREGQDPQASLF